jgi:hypothetical protein
MAHRIVLDVELPHAELLGQIPRANERGEAHRLSNGGFAFRLVQRQEIRVPPDAGGARLDALPADELADHLVVIVDLEGTEAELADVDG